MECHFAPNRSRPPSVPTLNDDGTLVLLCEIRCHERKKHRLSCARSASHDKQTCRRVPVRQPRDDFLLHFDVAVSDDELVSHVGDAQDELLEIYHLIRFPLAGFLADRFLQPQAKKVLRIRNLAQSSDQLTRKNPITQPTSLGLKQKNNSTPKPD